jgi:hypothetical protein
MIYSERYCQHCGHRRRRTRRGGAQRDKEESVEDEGADVKKAEGRNLCLSCFSTSVVKSV